MKNLLPEQRQHRFIHAYLGRVAVVASGFILAVEVIALVILLPTYLVAHLQQTAHKQALADAQRQISEGGGDTARAYLEQTSRLVTYAEAVFEYPRPTELVALLRTDAYAGIVIDDISLSVRAPNEVVGNVQGRAATRTALVNYSSALEEDPRITEAVVPLRDLATSQNIPFTLSVVFAELPN
jgi:hypothetical protein